jgi:tRNA(Ile)-lysidine synthase
MHLQYHEAVLEKVRATIARYGMIPAGTRVGVAVSGGIDSVVLLDILRQITPNLAVLHLNHRLRGPDSDGDERFVAQLAVDSELAFHSEAVDLPPGNTEQEAREARRAFFRRLRCANVVDHVATGHTRSDQAETVLYRLLRGSGTAGLSGILPVTDEGLIRPLLDCTRAEVEAYAKARDLRWREDHTNADPAYVRNRIRHDLLPYLAREFSEAIPDVLAGTADLARDEEDYWRTQSNALAAKLFISKPPAIQLRSDTLAELHPAVARRLLRRAIAAVKGDLRGIDLRHIEAILELTCSTDGHGRTQAPGIDVFRSFEWLRIAPPRTETRFELDYAFPVEGPARHPMPGCNTAIFLEIRPESGLGPYNTSVDEIDWDRLARPVELRNWYPGDEFHPPGRARRKVKVLFQEARVPIWERHSWPVLTSAGEIVWSRGFGVAEGFLPGGGTRTVLRVYEIEGDAPGMTDNTGRSGESDEAA